MEAFDEFRQLAGVKDLVAFTSGGLFSVEPVVAAPRILCPQVVEAHGFDTVRLGGWRSSPLYVLVPLALPVRLGRLERVPDALESETPEVVDVRGRELGDALLD